MDFERHIGRADPVGAPVARQSGSDQERRVGQSAVVATGTLACPLCDAPVGLFGARSPAAPLTCPICDHAARVRDFLSLGEPTRPARVEVRIVVRAGERAGAPSRI